MLASLLTAIVNKIVTFRLRMVGAEAKHTPIAIIAAMSQSYPMAPPTNKTTKPTVTAKIVMILTYREIYFSIDVTLGSAFATVLDNEARKVF